MDEDETQGSSTPPEDDARFAAAKVAGNGEEGREMLEHVAQGADLTAVEEKSALDWLLGDPVAIPHGIPVDWETPEGYKKLTFIATRSDPRKIDEIEQKHLKAGRMDQLAADLEIVATLCDAMTDGKKTMELTSTEFRTMNLFNRESGKVESITFADPSEALERRFRGQDGLLTGVARELRRIAGYDTSRVGQAERRLVEASLG